MKFIKSIPNLLTLSNLFLGCLAIVFILEGSDRVEIVDNIKRDYLSSSTNMNIFYLALAGKLIILAAIIDFLDGFIARLLKAQSAIGAQLDSLADMVTFGVAPAMIMYKLIQQSLAGNYNSIETNTLALWPAFLIAIAACYRLAKFNLDTEQSYYFKGLPTPSSALFILSLPFIILSSASGNLNHIILPYLLNYKVLLTIALLLAWLMVSNLPLMSLKFKGFAFADNWPKYSLIGISIILITFLGFLAVPIILLIYIISSILLKKQIIHRL